MKSAVTRTWYRIALAAPSGPPVLVEAQGEHLGVAIAAAQHHVERSRAIACEVAPDGPLGESVGRNQVIDLGPANDVAGFAWPVGVLPQLGATAQLAEAKRGWVHHESEKLFVLEAQTEADQLVDLYLGMVERLPAADNLEIRVLDHFDDAGQTDVWLTARVNAKQIIRFLDDHDTDLIDNGHVELSIYVRKHKATLRLTEHKTVVWIADTPELEADVKRWFGELGVTRVPQLVPISRVPHYHYRSAKTRDRKKLSEQLYRQRLRKVDTLRPALPPPADTDG
ncbi:MAG: hypothetical protein SFX73_08215 [Kofleriaceae bacterium]|nr:hypothetical protein [Kofleriaceae bacterium]